MFYIVNFIRINNPKNKPEIKKKLYLARDSLNHDLTHELDIFHS